MWILKRCLFVCLVVVATMAQDSDITKFMRHLGIIPDVIDIGPKDFLKISYATGVVADKGVELTPTQVRNQPHVEWTPAPAAKYTLLMTDPDAPSRADPKLREFHHWLVVNIPGNKVLKGDVLSSYIGSGPPDGTDLHRYVFLLFKQPKELSFDEPRLTNKTAEGRPNFNTKKFIEKYNLGAPVAGNFFQAKFDESVPELHKQLGL